MHHELVVTAMVVWSWDAACVPAAHNQNHHYQCRTPYAVVHTLVLLMMGIMMPETCWDKSLIINIRLVAPCWFLSLNPKIIQIYPCILQHPHLFPQHGFWNPHYQAFKSVGRPRHIYDIFNKLHNVNRRDLSPVTLVPMGYGNYGRSFFFRVIVAKEVVDITKETWRRAFLLQQYTRLHIVIQLWTEKFPTHTGVHSLRRLCLQRETVCSSSRGFSL